VTDWDGLDIWRTFTADDIPHTTPDDQNYIRIGMITVRAVESP
jgi:3'-phosphoadenosine 5'-phosphosulfate sulfotransferase (PAPS reductase)/FAD synthetase